MRAESYCLAGPFRRMRGWLLGIVVVLGVNLRAQTTPNTIPTKVWNSTASIDWFTATNWGFPGVPTSNDDVGVDLAGGRVIPQILAPSALARTLTLGRLVPATTPEIPSTFTYFAGQLVVGAAGQLTVTPTNVTAPGIQILQDSVLSIVDGGVVTLSGESRTKTSHRSISGRAD